MSKTKRHGSLIEKNQLLTWRDLELSFNSIAGKIYVMVILVMHYSNFLEAFSSVYNNCFPIKKVTTKKTVIMKPWLTKGLLKSIKKKNALYKRFLSSPTVSPKQQYKCFRNNLNHLLRVAKRDYYDQNLLNISLMLRIPGGFSMKLLNDVNVT